jgi:two-component system NarL family sensor kinase
MTEASGTATHGASESPPWVAVSRPGTLRAEPQEGSARVLVWVCVSAVLVLVAVAVVGVFAARKLAEREAVNDAANTADLLAEAVVQPALRDSLATSNPAAVKVMDAALHDYVKTSSIVRIKIWTQAGKIVYSDEPRLIGQTFALGAEERAVLTEPRTRADVSDLTEPENRYERGDGKLLEVYRPVWTPSGTPLLFETYAPYDEVNARSGQLWRGFAGVTVSSLLFFTALLVPILWRLLGRLRRAQRQREELLERAVDASVEERRRIAGTLHDGVVQELAATSFSLSGASARAEATDPVLAADLSSVASTLRASIGGLRSLLVDIYPASLESAGLVEALTDLAATLRSRGIDVDLDLTPDVTGLDPDGERLVFRIAQECLQNVRRHAAASHVSVLLRREDTALVLHVIDDGVGFDAAEVLDRPSEGHFGVRVLADVASDAGADLAVATAPGHGCHWRLTVPVG